MAVIGFAGHPATHADPRYLRVPLQPHGDAPLEVWRAGHGVRHGRDGNIAWASDGQLTFGAIEIEEGDGDLIAASEQAYRQLTDFVNGSDTPHLLRVWNYLDSITVGDGDIERYRQFCVGRAHGLGTFDAQSLPAATAIGRCDTARVLQVYWLSSATTGTPVENPRQVSAYHYPRQYGPQAPSFARAMLPPAASDMPLMLSGTAAVVGHASQHASDLVAQIHETFRNFDALIGAARLKRPDLPARFGHGARLKVYVRDAGDLELVDRTLRGVLGPNVRYIVLHAAICRRELAVEIDGVHA
nr:pteridine-dependent deoxygenase [Lysobacter silvestris]